MKKNLIRTLIFSILIIGIIYRSFAQQQKPGYEIVADGDGLAWFGSDRYVSISIFLNNNTNETLYYRWADCNNLLFYLKSNPYFHLANDVCRNTNYSKITLPPHRSQKMEIFLTVDKQPDRDILLDIGMKLYKWTDEKNKQQKRNELQGKLSDTIVLHYNSNRQEYSPREELDIHVKKEENILPGKDMYLLTDNDRKLYTRTIDKSKISVPRDTAKLIFRDGRLQKTKVVTIPVTLHNNSASTFRFYSMSCSWDDFFGTDHRDIRPAGQLCEKNIPEIVTVAPNKEYKRNLNIIYDSKAKAGSHYRISMSLLKTSGNDQWARYFELYDCLRFNKIWSDEITIQ